MSAVRAIGLAWASLVALLALTIGVSVLPIGDWRAVASLAIATAKAGLIIWIFMEFRYMPGLPRLMLLSTSLFLFVLAVMLGADLLFRAPL